MNGECPYVTRNGKRLIAADFDYDTLRHWLLKSYQVNGGVWMLPETRELFRIQLELMKL